MAVWFIQQARKFRTSLMIQWLRLSTSTAGSMSLISSQGSSACCNLLKKKKKKKQGNSEDIKVICEGSDRFHFRQFVLVPVEHPQLRKEVCIRDMVLAMISCSIISMETCRTWAQKNTPFVSKLSYLINKLILDCC